MHLLIHRYIYSLHRLRFKSCRPTTYVCKCKLISLCILYICCSLLCLFIYLFTHKYCTMQMKVVLCKDCTCFYHVPVYKVIYFVNANDQAQVQPVTIWVDTVELIRWWQWRHCYCHDCHFDENGDFVIVILVTYCGGNDKREWLQQLLVNKCDSGTITDGMLTSVIQS